MIQIILNTLWLLLTPVVLEFYLLYRMVPLVHTMVRLGQVVILNIVKVFVVSLWSGV